MTSSSLLELYAKIKDGVASDEEKMWFNVRIGMHSLSREYIIQTLEDQLKEKSKND